MASSEPIHPPSSGNESADELVLVVHGVGDPKPGETLSLFARSVAEPHHPLTEHQETLWLEDESDSARDVKTFGTHVRHLEFDGSRSTLAEVYWGDLSRVHRGLLGVLSGLIQIVFGLRYVAFVASNQKGLACKGLQSLGLICSRLVHGPVLAVNFVMAVLVLAIAMTESLWPGSSQVSHWASFVILGCSLFCLISSFLGWRLTRNSVCHRFWYWVMITSLFLNALMMFSMLGHQWFSLADYCSVMVTMLGAQWITLVFALLAMNVFWVLAMFQKDVYRPALHVALILPALAVGIWGQALPLMWVTGSHSIMRTLPDGRDFRLTGQTDIPRFSSSREASTPGTSETNRPGGGQGDRTQRAIARQNIRTQFSTMFDKAVPLIGVQCLMCLLLSVVAVIQLVRYFRWSEKSKIADFERGSRPPRVIVNGFLQASIGVLALVGMILVLYVSFIEINGTPLSDDWLSSTLIEANKYAVGILLPLGGLMFLSLHTMRPALDIVLDVTNHFYFRIATTVDRVRGFGEDFDIDEVTFDGGELYYSRRDMILRRIKRILEYYRKTMPGNPSLTIVSHSQGTMIAIEVMNDEELDWINQKFRQVNFITMGSPFHHIYQKYFRHFYPSLDHPRWTNLRQRVSRWLNIFRIDDFVGTEIEFPASLPQVNSGAYVNHAVERKGHMLYWCDRQVLSIIQQYDICRSLSPKSRMVSRRRNAA